MPSKKEEEEIEESSGTHSQFHPLSLARMVWKRKLCIGLVWVLLTVCTVVVVRHLPVVYSSEAVILVDSQKIPEKFVSATVASDLQDRIATIKQQILSTDNLKKIIDDFGLYREERKTRFEEEILAMMRKDISVTLEEGVRTGRQEQPTAFRIGFLGSNPALVTQVANRLANLYVDENLKTREVQAQGTSEFLDAQLQEAKKRLDELEAAVSEYKLKHNGELPEQQTALVGTLSRLQVELEANRDAVNRAQQTKIILENSLSAAQAMVVAQTGALQAARSTASGPLNYQPAGPAAPNRLEVLQQQLGMLLTQYRETHPDVIRLRAEIERLKRAEQQEQAGPQQATDNRTEPGQGTPNSQPLVAVREPIELARAREQVGTLKAQIKGIDKELDNRQAEQARILRDISVYQSRLERMPVREQEMAQITRDYEMSKENYKSLLDKKIAAGMALDMERRQKSERFTILDPARVPEKPIKPKLPVLYAGGWAASLILALLLGLVIELRQDVILGEWELPPDTLVLARLPHIKIPASGSVQNPQSEGKHVTRRKRLASVFAALVSVAGAVAAYLYFLSHRL